jgi:hypothetical protein
MIPSLPRPVWLRVATALYVGAFLVFLFLPLAIVAVFAFNNAPYPAPPWRGFTLDWFLGNEAAGRVGLFARLRAARQHLDQLHRRALGHRAVGRWSARSTRS